MPLRCHFPSLAWEPLAPRPAPEARLGLLAHGDCSAALGAERLANDVAGLLLADLVDALPRVEAPHPDHKGQALPQLLRNKLRFPSEIWPKFSLKI